MKKVWSEVFSSAVFRLIVIVLAVVIPLNLLTLVLGSTVISEVERQVSLETQGALHLYMNQLDDSVYRIGTKMYMLAHSDEDFSRLNEKKSTNTDEYYRQMQSVVRLRNTMQDILDDHSLVGGIYAYFPDKGYFLQEGGTNAQNSALASFVLGVAGREETGGWRLADVEGEPMLLLMSTRRNACYGAWISLLSLARGAALADKEDGFLKAFTDGDGNIYYANSSEIQHIDLSAPYQKINGESCTAVWALSERTDLCYVRIMPKSQMANALPAAIRLLQALSVVSVLVLPVIVIAMQHWIVRPVNLLTGAMERIEQGDVDYRIPQSNVGSDFDHINSHFNRMMDEVSELKISMYEQQLKTDKIRLAFLSQQIHPHFILNALNILYSYEPEEYPLIQKMILCLSKYFRYVVNANEDFVELGQEFQHIQNYLDIQQARFLRAFRAEIDYDPDVAGCLIPPLIIQTFIENAIKHALVPEEIIAIRVHAYSEENRLHIQIMDTGGGISETVLERIEEFRETREFRRDLGVGIQNTIDRLDIIFGKQASLSISQVSPRGTQVKIQLPAKTKESAWAVDIPQNQ